MRFLATFAAAFVSALVVAFPILPFGLGSPLAVPLAFLCGALASGLGAWAAGGRQGRLLPVLGYSLASVVVLAVPLGAVLFFVARTSLSISAPIVLAVVAAASAYAARRRGLGGTGGSAEGRAGPSKTVAALAALAVLLLLLLPVADLGYLWITACRGEEKAGRGSRGPARPGRAHALPALLRRGRRVARRLPRGRRRPRLRPLDPRSASGGSRKNSPEMARFGATAKVRSGCVAGRAAGGLGMANALIQQFSEELIFGNATQFLYPCQQLNVSR
ncbi:MAG: hypothetical protein M3P49_10715 [Actinomycetota bacterium]|nr:hypothetical protein [Actinomycetota bacterium]